ncbi:hypothetical protein [Pseudomonas mosselii]|uniref:hypothetical protein n=1 Tax=Pseudomonas mosselii TaxID=78327 RepID=UPI0012DABBFF|nr:hypothetical protein [Pseudomonas mosselii]MEA3234659.1 hypothetical protein [Pseudomonas mosselii]UWS65788.1 hypothetical protein N0U38_18650 [Pseudomonas mosselii]
MATWLVEFILGVKFVGNRLFTTYYWGYKSLSEDDVLKMSAVERIFVVDRLSERDNLEYVPAPRNEREGELLNEKVR